MHRRLNLHESMGPGRDQILKNRVLYADFIKCTIYCYTDCYKYIMVIIYYRKRFVLIAKWVYVNYNTTQSLYNTMFGVHTNGSYNE